MSTSSPPSLLLALEREARRFGLEAARSKQVLLSRLHGVRFDTAPALRRFHDVLCFLRAYPDDAQVLALVEQALEAFAKRRDLRRHRRELSNSGIQGTDVRLGFYAPMARWVAKRWGDKLRIDWRTGVDEERLRDRIYLLGLEAEVGGLDHASLSARAWIDRMRRPDETDGAFLVRRFSNVPWKSYLKDTLFDELEVPLVLEGGPDTPSRTRALAPRAAITWQERPLDPTRPDLGKDTRRPPLAVRSVSRREGRAWVDLSLEAMVTRDRALDAFAGGDPDDVRIVDAGEGLEFVLIGSRPEWRMLLEGVYGWLMLKNRVPIGYVLTASLFKTTGVALNVFPVWRGGEAARIYGRVLATARALFGTDTFSVDPYQLGHGNKEGLASGAWWFYQKLGFRPRDPRASALMEDELRRMKKDPSHRSPARTLKQLVRSDVYLELGRRRPAVLDAADQARLGLAVTDALAARFGSRRDEAERVCADEVVGILGLGDWRKLPLRARKAWLRWAPLLRILPGLDRWSKADARGLLAIVKAKAGRRENDYVLLFDAHPRLGKAMVRLANASRPERSVR